MKPNRFTAGLAFAIMLGLGLVGGSPARADFFQNSTGLASPTQTITFDEVVLPLNTAVTNQYAAYGVTFTPSLYYDHLQGSDPNITGNVLWNFNGQAVVTPFGIHFATPQSAAAFAMATNPGATSSFIALLAGIPVETDTASTTYNSADDFYGFQNITFDEIRVAPGGFDNAMFLDNLQTSPAPAPEPGSLALLATGGLPLLGFIRRRRAA